MSDYRFNSTDKVERLTIMLCEMHEQCEQMKLQLDTLKKSFNDLRDTTQALRNTIVDLRTENTEMCELLNKINRGSDGYKPKERTEGC